MNKFIFSIFGQLVCVVALTIMFAISLSPKAALAGFVTNLESSGLRQESLTMIQKAMEDKIISNQLSAYGYSKEEITNRIAALSDDEIHFLASNVDQNLNPSAGAGAIVFGGVIVVLVILGVLSLAGKRVVVAD